MASADPEVIWADFREDGTINEPLLQDIRRWSRFVQALAEAAGMKTYADKATMNLDTSQADGTPALLWADPTPTNNFPTVWIWDDGGNTWVAGVDRLGSLQTAFDVLLPRIENRFPDPEGLGVRSTVFGGTLAYEGGEPVISISTTSSIIAYDIDAVGEFAPGNTVTFSGIRWSDAVGAVGTFSAAVRIRWLDANGAPVGTFVESKSPAAATTYEAFSINGVVPAGTAKIRFESAKGTTGTLTKWKPRFFSITSSATPSPRGRPRTDTRKVFPSATIGDQMAVQEGGLWRDRTGRIVSTADGPCAIAGIKWCFAMRDAVAVAGKVQELQDQAKGIKLLPAGAAPGVRDARGYGSGNGTGRMQADNVGVLVAKPLEVINLPAAQRGAPSGGFASTGLAKIPAGAATWAGCWVVGNHGRETEDALDTTSTASIVIPSSDGRVKLAEYNQAATTGIGSIQGVAVRTIAGVSRGWYNDKSAKLLREFDLATGVVTGTTINLSAITPNGVAWDAATDLFWVSNEGVASAQSYVAATGALGSTCIIPSNTDQMSIDPYGYLLVGYGNNGSDYTVDVRDQETNVLVNRWSGLPLCQAGEGMYAEMTGAGYVLTVVNDAGFHKNGTKPALNLMLRYLIAAPPPRANTNELMVCLRLRVTGTPSQSCVVIADGSPLDIVYYGWAVYVVNTTTVRFQARTNGDAAAVSVDFVVPGLLSSKFQTITIYASKTASSVRCWANGTELTAVGSPSLAAVSKKFGTNRISMFGLIGSTPRYLEATDVAAAIVADTNDRAPAEAYMALLTAGLP